jgi:hypothetical protein
MQPFTDLCLVQPARRGFQHGQQFLIGTEGFRSHYHALYRGRALQRRLDRLLAHGRLPCLDVLRLMTMRRAVVADRLRRGDNVGELLARLVVRHEADEANGLLELSSNDTLGVVRSRPGFPSRGKRQPTAGGRRRRSTDCVTPAPEASGCRRCD